MSSPPPSKKQKHSPTTPAQSKAEVESTSTQPSLPPPIAPKTTLNTIPPPLPAFSNPKKRRASHSPQPEPPFAESSTAASEGLGGMTIPSLLSDDGGRKRGRTNTPWTAAEEQRLKQMRDAGNSWGEIAKAFPLRTEGSVKKHWYKDMHYAEFAEDESAALREAIKEYEANKWKVIGQKVGKPAKACEQYAKEHFKSL